MGWGHLRDFAHDQELPVADEIVSLGKIVVLEVNEEDIQKLPEEHEQELTTAELMYTHREQ